VPAGQQLAVWDGIILHLRTFQSLARYAVSIENLRHNKALPINPIDLVLNQGYLAAFTDRLDTAVKGRCVTRRKVAAAGGRLQETISLDRCGLMKGPDGQSPHVDGDVVWANRRLAVLWVKSHAPPDGNGTDVICIGPSAARRNAAAVVLSKESVAWAKGGSDCKSATLTFQGVVDYLDVVLAGDDECQNGLHSHLAWAPACVRMKSA
jgi:hypothetical protein